MLPTESGDPEIIRWNRSSGLSQLNLNSRVVRGGLFIDVQYSRVFDQAIEPAPISSFVAGLRDAIAKFPNRHDREREMLDVSQDFDDFWLSLCNSRNCICIQNQSRISEAQISVSITSNASSINLLILSVSLCSPLSLPTCFIHGL